MIFKRPIQYTLSATKRLYYFCNTKQCLGYLNFTPTLRLATHHHVNNTFIDEIDDKYFQHAFDKSPMR